MTLSTVRIDEFARMKYGKMPKKEILSDSGYPVYSGYRITGYAKEFLYSEPKLIVVARGVGGTGDVKISPPNSWITNLAIVLDLDESKVDKRYLLYKLGREPLKEKLNTGAAQAQITIDNLSSYKIRIPELATQKSIVEIISQYDDLIENNKRRIELLEESARQLYKEWFVRFRFPGHEHVKIIDGVPDGWSSKLFEEVAEVRNGFAFKSEDYSNEGMPVVRTRDFSSTRYIYREEDIRIPDYMLEKYKKYQLSRLDFLLIMVGASLGKFGVVTGKDLPALQNQNMWAIYTKSEKDFPQVYLIEMMQALIDKFLSYRVGAAREFFKKDFVKKQKIVLPPANLLGEFVETTGGIYVQIENLLLQNEKLVRARDLLLPKLMNGEITV